MAKQADRPAQSRNKKKKVQFIVSREFAGSQTMQEAFEQLILQGGAFSLPDAPEGNPLQHL